MAEGVPRPADGPAPATGSRGYVGRFAPSPTGPLHAGSLATALASWLDARAAGGRWEVRIEDVDTARSVPGAARSILDTLVAFGLVPDGPVMVQSTRGEAYAAALARLRAADLAYGCACTRREIAQARAATGQPVDRHGELVYPGTCRAGTPAGRAVRAWRLRVAGTTIDWHDRRLGDRHESLEQTVGDFVLRRADGDWAYQLAVVVDDAAQGITDVVRGEDLAGSTARQIHLQRCLGVPTPRYLHVPVVTDARGEKLSKQTGAQPLDASGATARLQALAAAGTHLGLGAIDAPTPEHWLQTAVPRWAARWRALSPGA